MPRIKDYPKYEDHVDKTMTWDKGNKELLPPGRTKLLQDGRFIFDMDDGTYTVSMQYFIENVLGLVNKDKKTIVSDVTVDGLDSPQNIDFDKLSLTIHKEEIDIDGNLTGHKTTVNVPLAACMAQFFLNKQVLTVQNHSSWTKDGYFQLHVGDNDKILVRFPFRGLVSKLRIKDSVISYNSDGKDITVDLKETINNVASNNGKLYQKIQDLVDFRTLSITPLVNSAITRINVSDAGNMHWLSYDGNTTDGSYDFGALIAKKVAEAKSADLPTDLTRNLNISDSGTMTWTSSDGQSHSVNLRRFASSSSVSSIPESDVESVL